MIEVGTIIGYLSSKISQMKFLFFFTFLFSTLSVFTQDTLELQLFYDGSKSFTLLTKTDSTLITTYENGSIDCQIKYQKKELYSIYTRYYRNGKRLWEKQLKASVPDGKSTFFNSNGTKIAEFTYQNGTLVDTVYLRNNSHLIFGKVKYSSTIYGGVENENGQSNISTTSGPFTNFSMFAANVGKPEKATLVSNFKTDSNGDFFIIATTGLIGFFPRKFSINDIKLNQTHAGETHENSSNSSWEISGNNPILENSLVNYIELVYHSVGYAP